MPLIAGVNPVLFAAALVTLYALGYVAGAWLVPPAAQRPSPALAVVRLVAGLFLSTTLFMLGMAVGVPWWIGPAATVAGAIGVYRLRVFQVPRAPLIRGWEPAVAGAVAFVLVAPVLIASVRMGPGQYPPIFFNVDTPYFLEKVHSLVRANELPPPSLGMLGGKYVYHYGSHAAAALLSRVSTLPPHQTLFLVLIPAMLAGILAAAVVAARAIGSRVPWLIAVPLLLIVTPSLWYPFWHDIAPPLRDSIAKASLQPIDSLLSEYQLWGTASVSGQNVASQFILLAAIGGIARAPAGGWRLPVFLIGSAVLFKAQTGLALLGGFALMEAWESVRTRSVRPLLRVFAAASVFAVVYSALWMLPRLPVSYRTELRPFSHLMYLRDRDWLTGFFVDLGWLLSPLLVLLPGSTPVSDRSRLSLLIFAMTPLIIVNVLGGVDLRPGMGIDEDWFQIAMAAPILVHAAVLLIAEMGWTTLSVARKAAFVTLAAVAIIPPVVVSAHYSEVLVSNPAQGHEFVDNHALGEALRVIPVEGSLLVTNDLRYPAGGFARTNRQMQIPALFGHQAFAINYAYEVYDFSADRLALQRLLEADHWSEAIDQAARRYGWTHFIVRKDYSHPRDIPLDQVFDSPEYAVFRFPRAV